MRGFVMLCGAEWGYFIKVNGHSLSKMDHMYVKRGVFDRENPSNLVLFTFRCV